MNESRALFLLSELTNPSRSDSWKVEVATIVARELVKEFDEARISK